LLGSYIGVSKLIARGIFSLNSRYSLSARRRYCGWVCGYPLNATDDTARGLITRITTIGELINTHSTAVKSRWNSPGSYSSMSGRIAIDK
jgi:hypothetical protein